MSVRMICDMSQIHVATVLSYGTLYRCMWSLGPQIVICKNDVTYGHEMVTNEKWQKEYITLICRSCTHIIILNITKWLTWTSTVLENPDDAMFFCISCTPKLAIFTLLWKEKNYFYSANAAVYVFQLFLTTFWWLLF